MFFVKAAIPYLAWLIYSIGIVASTSPSAAGLDQLEGAPNPAAFQEGRRRQVDQGRMYRHLVSPQWLADNEDLFWYRNDLASGQREFVVVDAANGKRSLAFDHDAMNRAIKNLDGSKATSVSSIELDTNGQLATVVVNGQNYLFDQVTEMLTKRLGPSGSARGNQVGSSSGLRTGAETTITFVNQLPGPAEIFWLSDDGAKQSYGMIEPGKSRDQHTFGGHRWLITNDKQESFGEVVANDAATEVVIDGRKYDSTEAAPRRRRRRASGNFDELPSRRSPDGHWEANIEKHNVVIRAIDGDQRIELSSDGVDGHAYEGLVWSPDSQHLIAFRAKSVEIQQVHLVRSSPADGGRAQLESRRYALPGDPFPTFELNLFSIGGSQQRKPMVDLFESEWQKPRIRFSRDGKRFYYEQTDRGHARFRLIEVSLETGVVRNIIDERAATFIWTAHTENQSLPRLSWLTNSDELIYATEKNGWRQLILVDCNTGDEKREITPRGIVVRGIESIDEEKRRVWISACGRTDQDPYHMHFAHVDLDGGKLTWLTDGDGSHSIEYSPNRKYLIDTYSRVDLPPISELRRCDDGQLVCRLESADVSEIAAGGWTAPEVFVAKGRDGQTDIWGIICRPRNFDPTKSYPVIEDIYAGPHGSFVPKTFSPSMRYDSLTSLGFIVVKIDGMGTANRSKAFQDVCWKNLKDAGLEDRILWMKAAAKKHPQLDLDRVGIYGTSAGGQNAAAAVLFHPEFYKVAVAACGCHDNRMDKASWNEQWMGYPVEKQYAECSNIDNAHRLQGKLLLIVGEMDENVPPESTMRFADALIRANKDFDLLVVPNAGHGMGGAYGQRRMHGYFAQHLLDKR